MGSHFSLRKLPYISNVVDTRIVNEHGSGLRGQRWLNEALLPYEIQLRTVFKSRDFVSNQINLEKLNLNVRGKEKPNFPRKTRRTMEKKSYRIPILGRNSEQNYRHIASACMTRETIYSLIFELNVDVKNLRTNLNVFGSLHVQALPSPAYPRRQRQTYESSVLVQRALE